ncbi:SecY-interacting protein [Edaphovirga cremea]|uniref:SecY-interacting protein n=1 Tax=Edaphovirga cremea TaxID=2267246 RepID=UPI000DF0024B|nr:SecY-interacting protein [Edaphovirga cremea]
MTHDVSVALREFTDRYVALWQRETGFPPASEALYGVPSPCIERSTDDKVFWLPQPFVGSASLANVERALEISLREEIHRFYTSQFAGDMSASWNNQDVTLLQVWSEDDFIRLQENLIGHLVTQKRLKLGPTLFLATTESEMEMISLCNVSGQVIQEQFGTKRREKLTNSLSEFLFGLAPRLSE